MSSSKFARVFSYQAYNKIKDYNKTKRDAEKREKNTEHVMNKILAQLNDKYGQQVLVFS